MFDLEKFKTGEYYVHLPTQEIYDDVMEFLDDNGFHWIGEKSMNIVNPWIKKNKHFCIRYDDLEDAVVDGGYGFYKEKTNYKELKINASIDLVKSPNHYIGDYGLEVEEVLRNFIPRYEEAYVAHRVASAIEYLLRSPLKNGTQDLEKAGYNIQQALEHIEEKSKQ